MPKAQHQEREMDPTEVARLMAELVLKVRDYLMVRHDVKVLLDRIENVIRRSTYVADVKLDEAPTHDIRFYHDDEGTWLHIRNLDLFLMDPDKVEEIARASRTLSELIGYYTALKERLKVLSSEIARLDAP